MGSDVSPWATRVTERQHVVVTGASSGIGAAITHSLASEGHALYVCARRAQRLEEVTNGNKLAFGFQCDVSDEDQVKEFADKVAAKTEHVDAIVNCAGGFGSIGPAIKTDTAEWKGTIDTIVIGAYLMAKHFVPLMAGSASPRIINFAGGGAFNPVPNYSAYAVSKAALVRLTENLAVELAESGIAVNALAPGFVDTEIHHATLSAGPGLAGDQHFQHTNRMLSEGSIPVEVPVSCVNYLLSEEAQGLTGKTISASFDPWDQAEFTSLIPEINQSDLYTMQRINLVHLPDDGLRALLDKASAKKVSS